MVFTNLRRNVEYRKLVQNCLDVSQVVTGDSQQRFALKVWFAFYVVDFWAFLIRVIVGIFLVVVFVAILIPNNCRVIFVLWANQRLFTGTDRTEGTKGAQFSDHRK